MFHVLQTEYGYIVQKTAALQCKTEPAADACIDAGPVSSQTIFMRMSSKLFRPVVDLSWTCLPIMDILNGADICRGGRLDSARAAFQLLATVSNGSDRSASMAAPLQGNMRPSA